MRAYGGVAGAPRAEMGQPHVCFHLFEGPLSWAMTQGSEGDTRTAVIHGVGPVEALLVKGVN